MEILQAIELMGKAASDLGADSWDIVGGESRSSSVSAFNQKIQNTEVSASRGVGIRAFKNGSPGYASTERLSEDSIRQTVKDALTHCELTNSLDIVIPESAEAMGPEEVESTKWNPELNEVSLETMADFALEVERKALDVSEEIVNAPYLGVGKSKNLSWFLNSRGVDISRKSNSYSAGIGVVAARGELNKMGIYSMAGRDFSESDSDLISTTAANRGLEMLDLGPIEGGLYDVMLHNRISGQIFSMFSSPYFAETVQKGQSRLTGKLGDSIADSKLTLLSEPMRTDLPGSRLFDGEGIPTRTIEVIKDGNLQSFLYNLESAAKDKVSPTGNASRSYSGAVGTGFHNLIVQPGEFSDDQLRSHSSKCLEIVKLEGGSGCSAVSGEISIGAQGFLVENGVRKHAVDGLTISINYFDLIKNILGISSEYNTEFSSVKVPSMLIHSVNVAS